MTINISDDYLTFECEISTLKLVLIAFNNTADVTAMVRQIWWACLRNSSCCYNYYYYCSWKKFVFDVSCLQKRPEKLVHNKDRHKSPRSSIVLLSNMFRKKRGKFGDSSHCSSAVLSLFPSCYLCTCTNLICKEIRRLLDAYDSFPFQVWISTFVYGHISTFHMPHYLWHPFVYSR